MAKNSIFDPTKDGVKADNSGYSSNQIDTLINESAAAVIDDDAAGDDTVYSSAKIYSLLPEDTATGAEVTITDACPDLPIVELHASINAVQEGTGDPSPENVRPISGWDVITVTHDSVDVEISLGDNTVYGGTYNSDGTLTLTYAVIDLGDINWTYHPASGAYADFFDGNLPNDSITGTGGVAFAGLCSIYKAIVSNQIATSGHDDEVMALATGQRRLIICDKRFTSKETFTEGVTGIDLIYPLLTPVELTVDTLAFNTNGEGSTIISCDSGDVTVKYKKLTTLS